MPLPNYNDVTAERPANTYGAGGLLTQQLELMPKRMELQSRSDPGREPFVTIDDLVQKAQELFAGLKKLSEFKYPLDVRRGIGKGVEKSMSDERESQQIKGSGRTYFFDVEKTRDEKPYLRITESRKGEGDKFERNSILVFPEDTEEFSKAVSEMVAKLG